MLSPGVERDNSGIYPVTWLELKSPFTLGPIIPALATPVQIMSRITRQQLARTKDVLRTDTRTGAHYHTTISGAAVTLWQPPVGKPVHGLINWSAPTLVRVSDGRVFITIIARREPSPWYTPWTSWLSALPAELSRL